MFTVGVEDGVGVVVGILGALIFAGAIVVSVLRAKWLARALDGLPSIAVARLLANQGVVRPSQGELEVVLRADLPPYFLVLWFGSFAIATLWPQGSADRLAAACAFLAMILALVLVRSMRRSIRISERGVMYEIEYHRSPRSIPVRKRVLQDASPQFRVEKDDEAARGENVTAWALVLKTSAGTEAPVIPAGLFPCVWYPAPNRFFPGGLAALLNDWCAGTCRPREADESHAPRCPECGYPLLGLPTDRCPECGSTFDRSRLLNRPRHRTSILDLVALAVLIVIWLAVLVSYVTDRPDPGEWLVFLTITLVWGYAIYRSRLVTRLRGTADRDRTP